MDKINIALCYSDNNGMYGKYVIATMASICHNTNEDICFYIYVDHTTRKNNQYLFNKFLHNFNVKIIVIDVDFDNIALSKSFQKHLPMLYRIYMMSKCKEKKIIYLDGDTLVNGDIKRLWSINIDQYYAAVVNDVELTRKTFINTTYYKKMGLNSNLYFNSGVMLLNLEKIQHDLNPICDLEIFSKKFQYAMFWDQDYLNIIFKDKLLFIKEGFNYIPQNIEDVSEKELEENLIVHFAGPFKPWNCRNSYLINVLGKYYSSAFDNDIAAIELCELLSKFPNQYATRMGLRNSLLNYNKKNLIDMFGCILKGILPDELFVKLAKKMMLQILYKFYYNCLY